MDMPDAARHWQQKIDRTFPHGVIITADDDSDGRTVSFGVPRPEVVAMRGEHPLVFIEIPSHDRNFSGCITGWDVVQEDPCTVVRVTFDMRSGERDETMRWSTNLSPGMVNSLRKDRAASMQASAKGELYHGEQWFA